MKVTKAIQKAHSRGDVNFYAQAVPDSDVTKAFMIISEENSQMNQLSVATIRAALHLKAAVTKFEIVPGPRPTKDTEITVRTRSAISAMRRLSDYVRVPEPHRKEFDIRKPNLGEHDDDQPPLKVEWAVKKPRDAFAAIQYQGYWFSIPQGDYNSKFSLIYLRTLLALADTGARPTAPILTIPTR
jgi:hypothetical protein